MTYALDERASNPDKPYGDVKYADPGYNGPAKYPIDTEQHCRAAWSYVNQADNAAKYTPEQLARIKSRIMAAGKKFGITFSEDNSQRSARLAVCTRSYDFEIRSVSRDGRRLQGTVAVFNKRSRIPDRGGDFEEEMMPGFMDRSLGAYGFPVMQFDHGKDPRVGTVPIGKYETFERRGHGYDVEGELFDNPVVEPVRQAIEARAIKGMSFRMKVTKNGDSWERRSGSIDLRKVKDADVPEAGPVVFPAYRDTSVSVRSILATFDEDEREELIRELRAEAGLWLPPDPYEDLTGQRDTWSVRGGDYDDESWEDEESTSTTASRAAHALHVAMLARPSLP